MKKKYIIISIFAVMILAGVAYFAWPEGTRNTPRGKPDPELARFSAPFYGLSFTYPKEWGDIEEMPGNKVCPEEDTYRTGDTLHIYDTEFRFPEKKLEGTESFVRKGVRIYKIDLDDPETCGPSLLEALASEKITGEEISSVMLVRAGIPGFYGTLNEQASRLNTETRIQYALFRRAEDTNEVMIIQPYLSFVPVSGSAEWKEIDAYYKNYMRGYIDTGKTAENLRKEIKEFKGAVETFRIGQDAGRQ